MKMPHIRLIATDINRRWAVEDFVLVVDGIVNALAKLRPGLEMMIFLADAL